MAQTAEKTITPDDGFEDFEDFLQSGDLDDWSCSDDDWETLSNALDLEGNMYKKRTYASVLRGPDK